MSKRIMTSYEEIWSLIESGETVHWANDTYKIYVEPIQIPAHGRYTERMGSTLSARCIENYFGSLLGPDEISACYIKINGGSNE